MKAKLRPMTSDDYGTWIQLSTLQQAKDRQKCSGRSLEVEWQELNKMIPFLLPEQEKTQNQHFYLIDTDDQSGVGFLWFGQLPGLPEKSIFLFDIHLHEVCRSKGIGREAMAMMHHIIKDMGYQYVYLNVLKDNFAQKLYASLGYVVQEDKNCTLTMMKSFT